MNHETRDNVPAAHNPVPCNSGQCAQGYPKLPKMGHLGHGRTDGTTRNPAGEMSSPNGNVFDPLGGRSLEYGFE